MASLKISPFIFASDPAISKMILRQYASNQPYLLGTAPLIVLLILVPAAWSGGLPVLNSSYPADELFHWIYANHVATLSTAIVLVIVGAILCNYIFNRHEFFSVPSYVIGLIYALLGSAACLVQCSLPALIAALFVLMGLNKQMLVFKQSRVLSEFFQSGFWYGMAAVFFPPFIILAFSMWLMVLFMRAFNWREHLLPLIAFCIPFLYWIVWKYLNDELDKLILFHKISSFNREGSFSLTYNEKAFVISAVICFVMALPRYLFLGDRSSNKARGVKNVFTIIALGIMAAFVIAYMFTCQIVLLSLLIPFVFIIGYWFTNYRYSLMAPLVFYLLCGVSIWLFLSHYDVL